jgi:YD repeat-containing protein
MSKKASFLMGLGLAGLLSIGAWSSAAADTGEQDDHGPACRLAGAYVGVIPGATTFIMSNVPLDPLAKNVLVTVDTTGDADPTSRGLFPTAVGQSHPTGFAVKEAPNKYAGQLVRYRYDSAGRVVSTEIQVTRVTQTDCSTLEVAFVAQQFYFGFVNPGDANLPRPDISVDVSKYPSFTAKLMLPVQP